MATPYRGNGLRRGVPAPFTAVRIDTWVLRLLENDLDEQADVEVAPGQDGGSCVVLRADGGLWVAVGNDRVWNIFGVPANAWRPASNVSGVVLRLTADTVRKVG